MPIDSRSCSERPLGNTVRTMRRHHHKTKTRVSPPVLECWRPRKGRHGRRPALRRTWGLDRHSSHAQSTVDRLQGIKNRHEWLDCGPLVRRDASWWWIHPSALSCPIHPAPSLALIFYGVQTHGRSYFCTLRSIETPHPCPPESLLTSSPPPAQCQPPARGEERRRRSRDGDTGPRRYSRRADFEGSGASRRRRPRLRRPCPDGLRRTRKGIVFAVFRRVQHALPSVPPAGAFGDSKCRKGRGWARTG